MSETDFSLPDIVTFTTEFIPEIVRRMESSAGSPSASPISPKKSENKLQLEEQIHPITKSDLVSHVSFFDRNKDGIILPWETFETLHSDLGINGIVSLFTTALLHLCMSYSTSDSWVPDPFFGIKVANISRCRLGSHSGVYDQNGKVNMSAFEAQFGKVDLKDYFRWPQLEIQRPIILPRLTLADAWGISDQNDSLLDFVGWMLDKIMWTLLAILENNSISKKSLLECYKGEVYFKEKKKNSS